MTTPVQKRFTFLISFRDGTTRTETYTDTDAKSARELCWKLLPAKDQDRSPTIKLLTNSEAA